MHCVIKHHFTLKPETATKVVCLPDIAWELQNEKKRTPAASRIPLVLHHAQQTWSKSDWDFSQFIATHTQCFIHVCVTSLPKFNLCRRARVRRGWRVALGNVPSVWPLEVFGVMQILFHSPELMRCFALGPASPMVPQHISQYFLSLSFSLCLSPPPLFPSLSLSLTLSHFFKALYSSLWNTQSSAHSES